MPLDDIGSEHRGRSFAIIIDEAHSSQGGRTSSAISLALAGSGAEEDDETTEDRINRIMVARKFLPNTSYFAFTATPKNKTPEIFGEPCPEGGETKHRAFHSYTMKQAIQEGFILDVLAYCTPVDSYYKLSRRSRATPSSTRSGLEETPPLRMSQQCEHTVEGVCRKTPIPGDMHA